MLFCLNKYVRRLNKAGFEGMVVLVLDTQGLEQEAVLKVVMGSSAYSHPEYDPGLQRAQAVMPAISKRLNQQQSECRASTGSHARRNSRICVLSLVVCNFVSALNPAYSARS